VIILEIQQSTVASSMLFRSAAVVKAIHPSHPIFFDCKLDVPGILYVRIILVFLVLITAGFVIVIVVNG
jgi:hypothetical protein